MPSIGLAAAQRHGVTGPAPQGVLRPAGFARSCYEVTAQFGCRP